MVVDAGEMVRYVDFNLCIRKFISDQILNITLALKLVFISFGEYISINFMNKHFKAELWNILCRSD